MATATRAKSVAPPLVVNSYASRAVTTRLYPTGATRGKLPPSELESQLMSDKPEETDPIRVYAMQNAALAEAKPKPSGSSWVIPFLASVLVTGLLLAAVYYFWGR